ncbi:MAG: prenyltransferase/squalene oxidase repeat-containing protein [Thermoguttaceae bacterium]
MIDPHQLLAAYQTVRRDLLAQREAAGHWIGRLSSSALATATAASALAVMGRHVADQSRRDAYGQMAVRAGQWLAGCQNDDGGWGDTDRSASNLAATLLVEAALHLAGITPQCQGQLERARQYIDSQGGLDGLRRRYGDDRTFAAPIAANCALAGLTSWREVPALPFELACLPHAMLRFLRLGVVSYALPALVAIGQARFFHRGPWNPAVWLWRRLSVGPSLRVLGGMQPPSGGFLEAVPLTSFVVMSLASTGQADHAVVRHGVSFLLSSVREDGSWPIDVNLAVWNTALATTALAAATGDVGALGCVDWLLQAQQQEVHPFTRSAPGGWGWSDAAGAVPDADDTAAALLALKVLAESSGDAHPGRITAAAAEGIRWLLDLQNEDGGWPTFCRGWGALPFDRSGCDLTAHALRALHAWEQAETAGRAGEAVERGLAYLAAQQRGDGSWVPLWFGNEHFPEEENPVYGTARVLLAYRDLGLMETGPARRGVQWLAGHTDPGGGWGGGPGGDSAAGGPSIEETALAVEALLAAPESPAVNAALEEGLAWLVAAVHGGRHREAAPIGFYFAKLWYYEKLYPLLFAVAALGQAIRRSPPA